MIRPLRITLPQPLTLVLASATTVLRREPQVTVSPPRPLPDVDEIPTGPVADSTTTRQR
jgi:hypothetical protein